MSLSSGLLSLLKTMTEKTQVVVREPETVADLTPIKEALSGELASRANVSLNLGQEVLAVPADRVRLCLREYEDRIRARASWQTPAGVLVTLVTALVASEFKDIGLEAPTWKALFVLVALLCVGLLIRSAIRAYQARSQGNDIEALVERLRRSETVG